MTASTNVLEVVLNLAWDQWTRLGVRGASTPYLDGKAVGLEELVILTSVVAADDPRLRDEALDWCAKNAGLISKPRLKGVLHHLDASTFSRFGQFSAALAHHVGGRWPGVESSPGGAFPALTNKSAPPPLMRAELIQLRVRALFGVDARADLLSTMLDLKAEFGASDFRYLGYTKRSIATALNALQSGGILTRTTRGNQHLFRWTRRDEFAALVAPVPAGFPPWLPLVRFMTALLRLSTDLETKSPRMARVAAASRLQSMTGDLETLRLAAPQEGGPIDLELLTGWIDKVSEKLATPNSGLFGGKV